MGYKKGPVGHMKSSTENKAVGYMAEGSAAYMETMGSATQMSPYKMDQGSPAKETDPNSKDGVTVTGDASKIGGKTTKTEKEKRLEEVKKKVEAKRIKLANEREAKKLKVETRRADAGKKVIAKQQQRRKEQGKDYIDPDGNVVRRS